MAMERKYGNAERVIRRVQLVWCAEHIRAAHGTAAAYRFDDVHLESLNDSRLTDWSPFSHKPVANPCDSGAGSDRFSLARWVIRRYIGGVEVTVE